MSHKKTAKTADNGRIFHCVAHTGNSLLRPIKKNTDINTISTPLQTRRGGFFYPREKRRAFANENSNRMWITFFVNFKIFTV